MDPYPDNVNRRDRLEATVTDVGNLQQDTLQIYHGLRLDEDALAGFQKLHKEYGLPDIAALNSKITDEANKLEQMAHIGTIDEKELRDWLIQNIHIALLVRAVISYFASQVKVIAQNVTAVKAWVSIAKQGDEEAKVAASVLGQRLAGEIKTNLITVTVEEEVDKWANNDVKRGLYLNDDLSKDEVVSQAKAYVDAFEKEQN